MAKGLLAVDGYSQRFPRHATAAPMLHHLDAGTGGLPQIN